ncbi:putative dipeptidase [Myxococcus hansupus]|uniref:Putative dipeptidase n=1 Tax=Pseudomyxococcus hansupus TaxID=1297742 RepID=A0A0H4WP94_9BACT|nr:dipeptidase [Myxococcus hansupus]AKQ63388.1 putative dipeptidase [Myxococcus hansupus]
MNRFVLAAVSLLGAPVLAAEPSEVSAKARAIHESALIIDTHLDTPLRMLDEGFDLGSTSPEGVGHVDLARARAGNLGAGFFSIWVSPQEPAGRYTHRALRLIDAVLQQVERHPEEMVLALSSKDIVAARSGKKKRLATLMGVEGGHAIEDDLGVLRLFYRLGVRYMTLTWSNSTGWADSSGDLDDPKVKRHGGLTDFGRDVVREMNRLGMLVDVSHVADATFFDVMKVTRAPVIASHSSARALANHPRNMTDDMLKAVAANGGVVMVNFYAAFIDDDFRKASAAMAPERKAAFDAVEARHANADAATRFRATFLENAAWVEKAKRPPLEVLINHIDHIAKVAGVAHVGLGSDFDGIDATPQGIDSVADLPRITEALVARGYTREQLHKILGGNLLRVFQEAERVSRELRAASATNR